MACELCEHCDGPVHHGEGIVQDGYSYHDRCMKCIVCSETNLNNAEKFKGVVFCSECSRRIFHGCSTVRRVQGRKRRGKTRKVDGVIEIARLNSLMASDTGSDKSLTRLSSDITKVVKKDNFKKDSVDMATTTDVTQELLKHIYSYRHNNDKMLTNPVTQRKRGKSGKGHKNRYSDLRIAELGASTEVAHMALQRQSEVPVIIKSDSGLNKLTSRSISYQTPESGDSHDSDDTYQFDKIHWMDRRFRSILKLPYKIFKKNILTQSSLIDSIASSENERQCVLRKIKMLFRDQITEHQRRGLKRLFSTINRNKTPYKLGWLGNMANIEEDAVLSELSANQTEKRCKHFRKSHSYRCMRSQVMKLAGPTRSELAIMRTKLRNFVFFDFLRSLFNFNKQFIHMMTSKACT